MVPPKHSVLRIHFSKQIHSLLCHVSISIYDLSFIVTKILTYFGIVNMREVEINDGRFESAEKR